MSKEKDLENPISNISNEVKVDIMSNHIEPAYKKDVIELLKGKRCWRLTGQIFETISKIFVAVGSIVSFASGVYGETTLSFIAGSISTFSLATLQFASFSYKENKKQSNELNTLLKNIQLATLPSIGRSVDDSIYATNARQTQVLNQTQRISTDENYLIETVNNLRNLIDQREYENQVLTKELKDIKDNVEENNVIKSENELLKKEIEKLLKKDFDTNASKKPEKKK